MANDRMRLDLALVARGLVASRARARDLIVRRLVRVGNEIVERPAQMIASDMQLHIIEGANAHVARSAVKLIAALEAFGLSPAGRVALDLGASTGGFTQVLLERGVAEVYAVDVGHGQLHPSIAGDARVTNLEATDARVLDRRLIPEPIMAIVADVSFISLAKALPPALSLAAAGCWFVGLVKPQFELGPAAIGKGGIVRDPDDGARALAAIEDWLAAQPGWQVVGTCASPLPGKGGNLEHLIGAVFRG
jgi:23S rRNA (cytidine1920-2'-O)/16S rRNA (cytidine1409-2'-O)-methyltransferase